MKDGFWVWFWDVAMDGVLGGGLVGGALGGLVAWLLLRKTIETEATVRRDDEAGVARQKLREALVDVYSVLSEFDPQGLFKEMAPIGRRLRPKILLAETIARTVDPLAYENLLLMRMEFGQLAPAGGVGFHPAALKAFQDRFEAELLLSLHSLAEDDFPRERDATA